MAKRKLGLTILMAVIITAMLIGFVNLGVQVFYPGPEFEDFSNCAVLTPENREIIGGTCATVSPDSTDECCTNKGYDFYNERLGICECSQIDRTEFDNARDSYNTVLFFIFAGIGFVLLLMGLFIPNLLMQIIGMAAGGVLVLQGIFMNRENKVAMFITLGLLIAVVTYFTIKKLRD